MGPLHRRIVKAVMTVVNYPKLTLSIAALVLVASLSLAWSRLTLSTDQNKLFSAKVGFFQDYLDFVGKFPENEAIYVLVQAVDPSHPPPAARWISLADALDARLRALPQYIRSVETRVRPAEMGSYGLLFADPKELPSTLASFREFSRLIKTLAEKPGLDAAFIGNTPIERFFGAMNQGAAFQPDDFRRSPPMSRLITRNLTNLLEHPTQPAADFLPDFSELEAADPYRMGYSYLPDESDAALQRRILLIALHQVERFDSLTAISETVEAIRATVRETAAAYPDFHAGLTGRPALEADEMRTTDQDSRRAEIIALICVFFGLVLMLRSLWLALFAELALAVGIGWTFGWATVSLGELNLLSIVFVIALIGIGMDYLVQILTRYRREARRYVRQPAIWARVFRYVSPPILTACCGAAGAFFVALFTDFRGAADLGIIAGGGLLLCLLAGYTVLPALLVLFPPKLQHVSVTHRYSDHRPPPRHGGWRLIAPILWLGLLALGSPWAFKTSFNPNLLQLQASNLESVQLVHKLQTWSAVELSKNLDLLRQVRAAVQEAPTVARTDSILQAYDNAAWLVAHQSEVSQINWTLPIPLKPSDLPALAQTTRTLAAKYRTMNESGLADSLESLAALLSAKDSEPLLARLNDWQNLFIPHLRALSAQFNPPNLQDLDKLFAALLPKLPDQLRNHLISADGTYALYIYPKDNLWDRPPLQHFVADIEQRIAQIPGAPPPTGIAVNILHSTASIERSFYHATLYALLLIIFLVWLDLRRLSQTLVAISVLALGLPMLLILMGYLGISWNFANFFGLPILIGAGHEYGVFMVHRYREVLHNPRRVWRFWDVSDRALLLCAFITSISFGFFWLLGHHEGLRSLGWVMMVGTACIYLATIMVVRPLLLWRLGDKGVYDDSDDE